MKIHCSQLKRQARQAMENAHPGAWRASMVYLLLTTGIRMLIGLFFPDPLLRFAQLLSAGLPFPRALTVALAQTGWMGLFLYILSLICVVVLDFGYQMWCLGTTRGGIGEWRDLFSGFAMAWRVVLLRLAVLLYCFILYACAIMLASLVSSLLLITGIYGLLAAFPLFIAAILFACWRMLHYSLASYCLMDNPDMGVFHAIAQSRSLMRSHCGQFILLALSFLGWFALGILIQLLAEGLLLPLFGGPLLFGGNLLATVDIPLVGVLAAALSFPFHAWLTCYSTMSVCRFYDTLSDQQQSQA